jgi:TonB family protein
MKSKNQALLSTMFFACVAIALMFSLAMKIEARAYRTASSVVITSNQSNWTELDRGQRRGDFQFSRNRTLLYQGRAIAGIRFKTNVNKIAISPPAVKSRYAICVTFDDLDSAGYLLQLDSHTGKRLTLQGPPSVWAAWSPAGTHAVIGSYYEADETLYSISLPSGIVRRFSFKIAKQYEEESYDLDNLTWVNNRVFRLRVTINCNPYTDDNCAGQDREKILREYEIKANVATLVSDIRKLSPTLGLQENEKNGIEKDKVYTVDEVDIKAIPNKLDHAQLKSDCPDEVNVILRVTLHKSGRMTEVMFIESTGCSFDMEAIKAVRKLKFIPAMKDGHPVSQYIEAVFSAGR